MKNIINISITLGLTLTVFSCKDPETPKPAPAPAPTPVVEKPKVVYRAGIKLYNQFTFTDVQNFYRIYDNKFVSAQDSFDLCYLNVLENGEFSGFNYYVLGSPKDEVYVHKAYPKVKGGSNFYTSFYEVPKSFTYANFDTLEVSSGLKDFVEKNCNIIFSNKKFSLSEAMRSEDSFGWSSKSVYAIKTSRGKYGLIKIINSPTGTAETNDPLKQDGVVVLDIKIEK